MKNFKKLVSLLAVSAILAVAPSANVMEVEAAPTTHYVKYDVDMNEWRVQVNGWNNDDPGRELYYLNEGSERVQDGDTVIILGNEEDQDGSKPIEINARVGNLTVDRTNVVVNAKNGIDTCYINGETYAAVTGNITNAYVFNDAVCTFHSNISNLTLTCTEEYTTPRSTVTVGGTVAYAATANSGGILKEYYNFKAGTFYFDFASGLMTDASNYSTSGNGPAASAPAPSGNTSSSSSASNNTSSGAYDDVPKTGESNLVVWLFAAAAVCATGSVALKRREN